MDQCTRPSYHIHPDLHNGLRFSSEFNLIRYMVWNSGEKIFGTHGSNNGPITHRLTNRQISAIVRLNSGNRNRHNFSVWAFFCPNLASYQMIFEVLQSELFRINFDSQGSKIKRKIPEFNLAMVRSSMPLNFFLDLVTNLKSRVAFPKKISPYL